MCKNDADENLPVANHWQRAELRGGIQSDAIRVPASGFTFVAVLWAIISMSMCA